MAEKTPLAQDENVSVPGIDIVEYDNNYQNASQLAEGLLNPAPQQNRQMDAYMRSQAVTDVQQQQFEGLSTSPIQPGQESGMFGVDPDAVIGTFAQDTTRSIKAGWGDLVAGTGDTIDVLNAWFNPNDPDPSTSVGNWMRGVGEKYQNENFLVISEDLQDLTWDDMFKAEFWSSKVARLVPYAASFLIPYAGGAALATRFTSKLLIGAAKRGIIGNASRVIGTASKSKKAKYLFGKNRIGGSGLAGVSLVDKGIKGKQALELTRGVKSLSQAVGGGFAANMMEGVYLGGEAYNQGMKDGLTMEQASAAASDVVYDNAQYMWVDMAQYGLLFGGLGKTFRLSRLANLTPDPKRFGFSVKGLINPLVQRGLINLPTVGTYAGIEGFSEGVQETYQEWIKYKAIHKQQGKDYQSYTNWLKTADGKFTKEARDVFWTSVGLGGAMGSVRGYVDGAAERQSTIQERLEKTALGINLQEEGKYSDEAQMMFQQFADEVIAEHIYNYNGDGTPLKQVISKQVEEGKITPEAGEALNNTIDQMVTTYDKHSLSTTLTESGQEQAFYTEVRLERNKQQRQDTKNIFNEERKRVKQNVKDPAKQKELLDEITMEENAVINILDQEKKELENRIESFYYLKEEVMTKDGKVDKRYKKRMTADEFEQFTTQGQERLTASQAQEMGMSVEQYKEYNKRKKEQGTFRNVVESIKDRFKKGRDIVSQKIKDFREPEIKPTESKTTDTDITPQQEAKKKAVIELPEPPKSEKVRRKIPIKDKVKKLAKAIVDKGGELIVKASSIIPTPGGTSYTITDSKGKTIKFFNRTGKVGNQSIENFLSKYIKDKSTDVKIKIILPQDGEANVVKIDGQLFFQYNNDLYQYKMEASIDGQTIGTIEYRDYDIKDEQITRAKKTKSERQVKKTKDVIKKYFDKIKSKVTPSKDKSKDDNLFKKYDGTVPRRNFEVYTNSGLAEYVLLNKILERNQIPADRAYIVSSELLDSFGNEAVSLAIGNSIFIQEGGTVGTDIIHEGGHIYYRMFAGTPLIKRINELLIGTDIYDLTTIEYPELTLIDVGGTVMTLGQYVEIQKGVLNQRNDLDGDIKSIIKSITEVEGVDDTKTNNFYISLLTQLTTKRRGGAIAKRLTDLEQTHLLEESFVRTLEANSFGRLDAIIKDSSTQKKIEEELIKYYKEAKQLTTDEEARQFLDLVDDVVPTLSLDAAMKHILLKFGKKGGIRNSGYAGINRAKKKNITKATEFGLIHTYINYELGKDLTDQEIIDNVIKRIEKSGLVNLKSLDKKLKEEVTSYIESVLYTTKPEYKQLLLTSNDLLIDAIIREKGFKEGSVQEQQAKEKYEEESLNEDDPSDVDKYNEEKKQINMPKTMTNFFKGIAEIYNVKSESPFERKKLMYQLRTISRNTRKNPYEFISAIRNSKFTEIQQMLDILDNKVFKNQNLTDAKLLQINNIFRSMVIERLTGNMLLIQNETDYKWINKPLMSRTTEKTVVKRMLDSWKNLSETKKEQKRIALENVYNTVSQNNFSDKAKAEGTVAILEILFKDTDGYERLDTEAMMNELIVYNNKPMYLMDVFFDTKSTQYGPKLTNKEWMLYNNKSKRWSYKVGDRKAFEYYNNNLSSYKTVLEELMIVSRPYNYLSVVDNVTGDAMSIFNNNNALHNQAYDSVEKIINVDKRKKSIFNPKNNIFAQIIQDKFEMNILLNKQNGEILDNPFDISIQTGMYRYYPGQELIERWDEGARNMTNINPAEIQSMDFFSFLTAIKNAEKGDIVFYDQSIGTFSDKSRRYYVKSIAAIDKNTRQMILSRLYNNPAKNDTYIKGDRVLPFDIIRNKNGEYQIENLTELVEKFKSDIRKNSELYEGHELFRKATQETIENYLISYIGNRFMAQQLLAYDHKQAKNEVDYVKRLAGTIASHMTYDHNTSFEPIIVKDYYVDDNGNLYTEDEIPEGVDVSIENDAAGYILPEQAKIITDKYAGVRDVGGVYKFVYNYRQEDGSTVYLKFAVQVLTPEMEQTSEVHRNIATLLRERNMSIADATIPNLEFIDMFAHGNLVIAASESSAKLWFDGVSGKKGGQYVYDVRNLDDTNLQNILSKQDEIFMEGDINDANRVFVGLDGKGLGIQLELDKQTDERYYPSQLFYHLNNNMYSPANVEILNRMLQLRKNVMEKSNQERNFDEGMISELGATTEQIFKEMESFKSSVDPGIYGQLLSSLFGDIDGRYPAMNDIYNAIARGRVQKKGTKMYTKGSIAYQSSSLGMGLESFVTRNIDGRDVVVSEAFVPGYLQQQGVKVGDLFLGTRIPSHGKVSTSVFVVKGFHQQLEGTPTSKITIPAKVSKYWGADLDGDSIHMNFKYNENEIKSADDWRNDSNEFFDLYVDLVSKQDVRKEITADIEFENEVNNILGEDRKRPESQLTPTGDSQTFKENVPTKKLVGIVAALQRTLNVFSNSGVELGFEIDIEGRKVDRFFDDVALEDGKGNWFGLAQILNIVLDNAKHQYAEGLGINFNSAAGFVMLRRLGYSLQQVKDIYTSDVAKSYFDWLDTTNGKKFTSSKNTIQQLIGKTKRPGKKSSDFIKFLGRNLTKEENKILTIIYNLQEFNKTIAQPIGQMFTVHQGIIKNPLELRATLRKIELIKNNRIKPSIKNYKENKLGNLFTNPILTHAQELMELVLTRASSTDIRYTPYMQSITEEVYTDANSKFFYYSDQQKNKIINHIIKEKLAEYIDVINSSRRLSSLVEDFKTMKEENPNNKFLQSLKVVTNSKGREIIVTNKQILNEFLTESEIQEIKKDFSQLTAEQKDTMINIEYRFFDFGFKEESIIPLFDNVEIQLLNKDIQKAINYMQEAIPTGVKGIDIIEQAESEIQQELKEIKNIEDRLIEESTKERESGDTFDGKMKLTTSEEQSIISGNKKTIAHGFSYNDTGGNIVKLITPGSTLVEISPAIKRNSLDEITDKDAFARSEGYDNFQDMKENGTKYHKDFIEGKKPIYIHKIVGKPSTATENRRAKKAFDRNVTESVEYMEETNLLSFDEWLQDKGITIKSLTKGSIIYKRLQQRYKQYVIDYNLSEDFIVEKLTDAKIKKMSMDDLFNAVKKLNKLDGSASNRAKHLVRKEIAQRAFREQSDFLQEQADIQSFKFVKPAKSDDITWFRKWLGSNNMTSRRPEIQYMINEIEKNYYNYLQRNRKYVAEINKVHNELIDSKLAGISTIEKIKGRLNMAQRYELLYGNITNRDKNGRIVLLSKEQMKSKRSSITQQEYNYWKMYQDINKRFSDIIKQEKTDFIKNIKMGDLEMFGREGLFGLYDMRMGKNMYVENVKLYFDVGGTQVLMPLSTIRTYLKSSGATAKERIKNVETLEKLKRKATRLKKQGKHEDGSDITLTDAEIDALIDDGDAIMRMANGYEGELSEADKALIQEIKRRQLTEFEHMSMDLNGALLEYVRGMLFKYGDVTRDRNGKPNNLDENPFVGMSNMSVLVDAVIEFNKENGNKNAAEYLTRVWKDSFLEKKKPRLNTVEKIIDFLVRLTSLNVLGFNPLVAVGNVLAGKYQEYRKRGGKTFKLGEKRYWKDWGYSQKLLEKYRIIEYSFSDFVHLDNKKGVFGKIERASYVFMDKTENYIQGAAFLSMLTEEEYISGEISQRRVAQINSRIATLHGEGYTALDGRLLGTYALGRAALQFKKWFVTLIGDRFQQHDIDRFGEVQIGSYTATGNYIKDLYRQFREGEITLEQMQDAYNKMSVEQQREMGAYIRGVALAGIVATLILVMDEEDETDGTVLRNLKKLNKDINVISDYNRHINYTFIPSSVGLIESIGKILDGMSEGNTEKWETELKYDVAPFGKTRRKLESSLESTSERESEIIR
jgi:hypothetical protein